MPVMEFADVPIPPRHMEKLRNLFRRPTAVQSMTWPLVLSGFDVVGIAQTGSGKTLGFALPAFSHCISAPKTSRGPCCLVMAPTRELVIQVAKEFQTYSGFSIFSAYGGTRVTRPPDGTQIVVGTPGRVEDLMSRGWLSMNAISFLVLDEADRLLEENFGKALESIAKNAPKNRQNVMWTATWPRSVERVANTYMPAGWVQVSIGYTYMRAAPTIRQFVWLMAEHEKQKNIVKLLSGFAEKPKKALIFSNTRDGCTNLRKFLLAG
eukprot:gene4774-7347_t